MATPVLENVRSEELRKEVSGAAKARTAGLVLAASVASFLIHGYHPYSEDAAIYVQAVKQFLDPSLYRHSDSFFHPHVHLSIFPWLVAMSIRLSHLPFEIGMLAWQLFTIVLLLEACRRLCHVCFGNRNAALFGVLLIASLLTLPAAGSSLFLSEPYLTSRSLSTPVLLFAVGYVLQSKWGKASLWMGFAALIQPMMTVYGALFLVILVAVRFRRWVLLCIVLGCSFAAWILLAKYLAYSTPISPAYRSAVLTRSYFFLSNWTWYELLGLVLPLAWFAWLSVRERHRPRGALEICSTATLIYGIFCLLVSVAVVRTPAFLAVARFQPMRGFHLLYLLLFLLPVNLFLQLWLEHRPVIAAAMFLAVSATMFLVQRNTFPAEPHIEWPGVRSSNVWCRTFDWIRSNTPKDAIFALDPDYMMMPGEDNRGFRAYTERNSLPDRSKDGGVAAIFPEIAELWAEQVSVSDKVEHLHSDADVEVLRRHGVSWVVLHSAPTIPLDCPYRNAGLAVCRL